MAVLFVEGPIILLTQCACKELSVSFGKERLIVTARALREGYGWLSTLEEYHVACMASRAL